MGRRTGPMRKMGESRVPLAEAEALAAEVVELLRPSCTRLEVAGSIRRRKPDVGDIELVAIPTLVPRRVVDLFGATVDEQPEDLLWSRSFALRAEGIFGNRPDKNGRSAFGAHYKRLTYRGFGLDLFSCPAEKFGAVYTIRTGSAEFAHRLVTSRLMGGWLKPGLRVRDGRLWEGEKALETPEETDFLEACGVPWLDPELRTALAELVHRPRDTRWLWGHRREAGGAAVQLAEETRQYRAVSSSTEQYRARCVHDWRYQCSTFPAADVEDRHYRCERCAAQKTVRCAHDD